MYKNATINITVISTDGHLVSDVKIHVDPGFDRVDLVRTAVMAVQEMIYATEDLDLTIKGLTSLRETGEFPEVLFSKEEERRRNRRTYADEILHRADALNKEKSNSENDEEKEEGDM